MIYIVFSIPDTDWCYFESTLHSFDYVKFLFYSLLTTPDMIDTSKKVCITYVSIPV